MSWFQLSLTSAYTVVSASPNRLGSAFGRELRKVGRATYLFVGRGFMPGSEAEQGLERGHGYSPTIVAKDEFVEINLELIAAHTVVGSNQPLL